MKSKIHEYSKNNFLTTSKRTIILISFMELAFFFNACSVGYVSQQPSYVEAVRPQAPSNTHIWIDGNWHWNNQTQAYTQSQGVWLVPDTGSTHVPGYWKKNEHGYRWVDYRWQ